MDITREQAMLKLKELLKPEKLPEFRINSIRWLYKVTLRDDNKFKYKGEINKLCDFMIKKGWVS